MVRWPSLIVAVTVSVYWGRVLWMAARSRRRTGQSANFLPAEKLGRALRIVWIPVIGAWIALPWVYALRTGNYPPWQWIGAGVVVLAFAMTWVCWKKMGTAWRMGIDPAERGRLLVSGPWAWSRHPIYALSTLMMLGTVAANPTAPMAAVAVLHLALLQWEASREEKYLAQQHGDEYRNYRARVGRFIPRWHG